MPVISTSAVARRGVGIISCKWHVGAAVEDQRLNYEVIQAYMKVVNNNVPICDPPLAASLQQINAFFSGFDTGNWIQIGFAKSYSYDAAMRIRLYIEFAWKYTLPEIIYSPERNNGLLEIVSANSFHSLEIKMEYAKTPGQTIFSYYMDNVRKMQITLNYPYQLWMIRPSFDTEATVTTAEMYGVFNNLKWAYKNQAGQYIYNDITQAKPFKTYDTSPLQPPYHCVADSINSFHNVYGV